MQNFEKPVSIDTPNILFQKEIERIKNIINDSTVQTSMQVESYLTLIGLSLRDNPSEGEIRLGMNRREKLVNSLKQKNYPDSLDNVPIRLLEKLGKIPNGSDVVKNRDKLEAELEKQQAPIEVDEKEGTDVEGPLGKVRNQRLRNAYEKFIHTGIELDKRLNPPQNIAFNPFTRRNPQQPANQPPVQAQPPVQPQQPKFARMEKKALKQKAKKDMSEIRRKYKISPLTPGFLARRRISEVEKIKQKLEPINKELGKLAISTDTLLEKRKAFGWVVKNLEHKVSLINRSKAVGHNGEINKRELRFLERRQKNINPIRNRVQGFADFLFFNKTPVALATPEVGYRRSFFRIESHVKAARNVASLPINVTRNGFRVGRAIGMGIKKLIADLEGKGGEKK